MMTIFEAVLMRNNWVPVMQVVNRSFLCYGKDIGKVKYDSQRSRKVLLEAIEISKRINLDTYLVFCLYR